MASFSPGLAGARAVLGKHMRIFLRNPMEVTLTLFSPVLWLVLFGLALDAVLGGRLPGATTASYLAFLAPGLIALTALTASLFAGATFFLEVDRGEVKQYLAAPMARLEYYLGLASSSALKTAIQAVIILLLAIPLGFTGLSALGALATVLVTAVFALGAFGFSAWLASKSSSFEAYHGILIVLNLPLLFLSDALYPLTQVPDWLAVAASANPLTHLVELMRWLLVAEPSPLGLTANLAVLTGFTVLGIWLGGLAVESVEA